MEPIDDLPESPMARAPAHRVCGAVRFRGSDGREHDALVARVWSDGTVNLVYLEPPTRPDKGGIVVTLQNIPPERLL